MASKTEDQMLREIHALIGPDPAAVDPSPCGHEELGLALFGSHDAMLRATSSAIEMWLLAYHGPRGYAADEHN